MGTEFEDLKASLKASREEPPILTNGEASYAGSQAGGAVGSGLGSFAASALVKHRATAIVIGVAAGVAIGCNAAMRVVPRTLGATFAWIAVSNLLAAGGIIASAAVVHAMRRPR